MRYFLYALTLFYLAPVAIGIVIVCLQAAYRKTFFVWSLQSTMQECRAQDSSYPDAPTYGTSSETSEPKTLQDLFASWRPKRGDWVDGPGETLTLVVVCEDGPDHVYCIPVKSDGTLLPLPRRHTCRSLLPVGQGVFWSKPS